jgi:hypothetical protein
MNNLLKKQGLFSFFTFAFGASIAGNNEAL